MRIVRFAWFCLLGKIQSLNSPYRHMKRDALSGAEETEAPGKSLQACRLLRLVVSDDLQDEVPLLWFLAKTVST